MVALVMAAVSALRVIAETMKRNGSIAVAAVTLCVARSIVAHRSVVQWCLKNRRLEEDRVCDMSTKWSPVS